jgi:hypothetical protein
MAFGVSATPGRLEIGPREYMVKGAVDFVIVRSTWLKLASFCKCGMDGCCNGRFL